MRSVAGGLAFWVEVVTCDDDRCCVRSATSLGAYPSCVWTVESEEICEGFGGCLFNHAECGRDLEDVDLSSHEYTDSVV